MPFVTKARQKNDPVLRSPKAKLNKAEKEIFDIYYKALSKIPNDLDNASVLRNIRAAVEAGNPMDGAVAINWGSFVSSLNDTVPKLAQQVALSANISAKALPKRIRIESSFTAQDPRAIAWAQQRAGARILGITKESQKAVAETITRGLKTQLTRQEVVESISKIVGLDARQARALGASYEKNLNEFLEEGLTYEQAARKATKLGKEYRQRLLQQRATRIARTETVNAANAGRFLSWREADAQGFLPAGSQKRWKTAKDERVCSVCGPLHGMTIDWEEAFPTGDVMPTNHPNCRCTAVIVPADPVFEKVVEKRYYRFADGEETWRNYDYRWRKIANEMKRRIGKCQLCGKKSDLTVDHKKRLKDGGAKYDRKNLRVLCRSCNGKVSRLGTKLKKQENLNELFIKHYPGQHDQQNHAGGRAGGRGGDSVNEFREAGGSITGPLKAGDEEIGIAVATLQQMEEMLGDEFKEDKGVKFVRLALEAEGEMGSRIRLAKTEEGLAGAIAYNEMGKEEIESTYGMFEDVENLPEPHIYIQYLGSVGLIDKTGSALANSVFEEAANKGLGVMLESENAGSTKFWEKMGLELIEDSGILGIPMYGASASKIKTLVKT